MLGAATLKHPDVLRAYAPLLGADRLHAMQRSVAAEYRRLLECLPPFEHKDDIKDWIYALISSDCDMAPMRTHTVGDFIPFTAPLMDIAMLDFLKHVHFRHRLEKRLYRRVCVENTPEVFGVPRSRDRQNIADVGAVLRRDQASIRAITSSLDNAVPGLVLPGGFDAMLDEVMAPGSPSGESLISRREADGLDFFRKLTRLQILPVHWLQPIKRRFWNTYRVTPDSGYLFRRAMQLAMAFDMLEAPIRLPDGPLTQAADPST
jgi:hypothetical protein